ncbi:MAG: TetR/AcrR family transcriptional regulator [Bacteroidetes bacterium]|nr:TetR/AcrR family transcriptional regulator [Bacteroidota bacterium]MBS1930962.1 TetR/AcrR family transcriptional regulator [Bacteroidota bacterium]
METLVTKIVSIVLSPILRIMEPDIKERIRSKAHELFLKYGIRSISMDDIAAQLAMSKKTLYQYFNDKDELVDTAVEIEIKKGKQECQGCSMEAKDAIEEILLMMENIEEQFRNMNPTVLYDLDKFHHNAFRKFQKHKNEFILDVVRKNIERGIKEELFRPEINADILSRFRLESMMIAFNMDIFPPRKYNLAKVTVEIMEHYLYGLATIKGHKLILKYQQEKKYQAHETKPA